MPENVECGQRSDTILFVDDEESILEIAREFFEHKGFGVVTARNGREALDVLAAHPVKCCFTDINMPEMDGLELAEHIRAQDNTLPVIVMTGYPSLDNTIRTLKNGVVDFLIKPVNLNQMEVCVRRVLRERDLFVENLLLKQEMAQKERLEKINRDLEARVSELGLLNRILSTFTDAAATEDVFRLLVDLASEVGHDGDARFYLVNEAVPEPREVSRSGGRAVAAASPGSGVARHLVSVAEDGLPLLLPDSRALGLEAETGSAMAVPLKIREKVFGVVWVASREVVYTDRDLYYLSFMANKSAYAIENLALYENIYENLFSTLYAFVSALEARDAYTLQHSNRVAAISMKIGEKMGLDRESLDVLLFAGRLHDIGKIGIRDAILLKPETLTEDEFEAIKEHPVIGATIVGELGLWQREEAIIRYHHERFDGSGYPEGLSGDAIPLLARILSVADAYDAMASDRAYRDRMGSLAIRDAIVEGSGTQFDPDVVACFLPLLDSGAFD